MIRLGTLASKFVALFRRGKIEQETDREHHPDLSGVLRHVTDCRTKSMN